MQKSTTRSAARLACYHTNLANALKKSRKTYLYDLGIRNIILKDFRSAEVWQVIQSGPPLNVRERREAYWDEARGLLETAARAFPENRVIGMYIGRPVPWPQTAVPHPAAPEWANLQRDGLEKLHDIIRWWIAKRQLPDGQFGGGWCARRMGGFLPDALGKLRSLGGSAEYDRILRADGSGAIRYRLDGDEGPLVDALRRNAEAFRTNREGYTVETRWTDRVLSFTRNYLRYLPEPAPPAPQPEILYSTATGDPGNPIVFPLNAVRWGAVGGGHRGGHRDGHRGGGSGGQEDSPLRRSLARRRRADWTLDRA